jgi:hypothetical protein
MVCEKLNTKFVASNWAPAVLRSGPVPESPVAAGGDLSDAQADALLTGDLLYVKNSPGNLSHVVIWVGKIGKSPDGNPLVLDSTGTGSRDSEGREIPDGIQLRAFTPRSWYFRQASHVLRIIPEDAKGS